MTRAKFKCVAKTELEYGTTVRLEPVRDDSQENKQFWQATPAGTIEMQITTNAVDLFKVGKPYYVDFTAANPE